MRGDKMLFFKKKPKYLVFDNGENRLLIKINEIAHIMTTKSSINVHLINGNSLDFNCFTKGGRDKTYEQIKNILINEL